MGAVLLNRITPALPVYAYKTYGMHLPATTHWRPATCEEAGCQHYLKGWQTIVPSDSDHARLIRSADFRRRYRYTEEPGEGPLAVFTFPAGQACFKASTHKVSLGRPGIFTVRGGDWRGMTSPVRTHKRAMDWVEDFAEHQERLATAMERG